MKAKDLTLSSVIYYLMNRDKAFGHVPIVSIANKNEKIKIQIDPAQNGSSSTLIVEPLEEKWVHDDISYFLNKSDWYQAILPNQKRRIQILEKELSTAKSFLKDLLKNIEDND